MVTNYVAVCLFALVVSGASITTRPLERPTSLRVRNAEDKGILRDLSKDTPEIEAPPQVDGVDPALQDAVDPSKAKDPARQVEKNAGEAVPATLPPKETIRKTESDEQVKSAAELTGVHPNSHGAFSTLGVALSINAVIILTCMLVFGGLRLQFPSVYSGNVASGIAPITPDETFLGWMTASMSVTTEQAANSVGLDQAMLLEYCTMCCKICALIGFPMVCIMCPLHFFFGGGGLQLSELSSIAMGNVIMGHPWLYYVHAIVVNWVTVVVIQEIYCTMTKFLTLRYAWLKNLPAPRSVTVLVEGIPPEWRSDEKLREFFSNMFDAENIKEAVMVKNAPKLKQLYDEKQEINDALDKAMEAWTLVGNDEEQRPMMREKMCMGPEIDAIKFYEEKLAVVAPQVEEALKEARDATNMVRPLDTEREILADSPRFDNDEVDTVAKWTKAMDAHNTSTGFVTYTMRKKAAVCMNTVFSSSRDQWVISTPPPASDVLWKDLMMTDSKKKINTVIAYVLVLMVYLCFIPVVVMGTNITKLVAFGNNYVQSMWASFAPGLALMLCLAFLPTILLLIFRSFFTLKADCFAQQKLQVWYFFFLLFFVILVTCIGRSLAETFQEVVRKPELAMMLMAEQMPTATHFYMDFLMLQWGEQSINFLRNANLFKFLFFGHLYGKEMAKDLSEPEDQDYYGMGARSARFTINMCIGIIFSTLSPLIAIMALILFGLCRLFYGYLMVFAETKKADLGGAFFFCKLQCLLIGLGIYNAMMIAVLSPAPMGRARSAMPMLISLPSLIYTVCSYNHFAHSFVWQDLPYAEIVQHKQEITQEDNGLRYMQPEFIDEAQQAAILQSQSSKFADAKALRKSKRAHERIGVHSVEPGMAQREITRDVVEVARRIL